MHESNTTNLLTAAGPAARILLAVSGGPDSLAMLHWFADRQAWRGRLVIAHVNHGLTPVANQAEQLCRRVAAEFDVPFSSATVEIVQEREKTGESLEACARRLRYAALEKLRAEHRCEVIATAHTLDDDAETVFMRLLQDSSWFECTGIPVRRGRILRPFLHWRRAELRALLPPGTATFEDPMNADVRFPRVRARARLLAIQERHPETVSLLAESGKLVASVQNNSANLVKLYINKLLKDMGGRSSRLVILPNNLYLEDLDFLLPEFVIFRAVSNPCHRFSGPVRRQINAFLRGTLPEAELRLGRGWTLKRAGAHRWLEQAATSEPTIPPECQVVSADSIHVPCSVHGVTQGLLELNAAGVRGAIGLRTWRTGERFKPIRRHTRKVADWLHDCGVHPGLRRQWPVITDDEGIIAVPGLGIIERVAPVPNSELLRITWRSDIIPHV